MPGDFLLDVEGEPLDSENTENILLEHAGNVDDTPPHLRRAAGDALARDWVHLSQPIFDVRGRRIRWLWELH